jgi:hypothetical protein
VLILHILISGLIESHGVHIMSKLLVPNRNKSRLLIVAIMISCSIYQFRPESNPVETNEPLVIYKYVRHSQTTRGIPCHPNM